MSANSQETKRFAAQNQLIRAIHQNKHVSSQLRTKEVWASALTLALTGTRTWLAAGSDERIKVLSNNNDYYGQARTGRRRRGC